MNVLCMPVLALIWLLLVIVYTRFIVKVVYSYLYVPLKIQVVYMFQSITYNRFYGVVCYWNWIYLRLSSGQNKYIYYFRMGLD